MSEVNSKKRKGKEVCKLKDNVGTRTNDYRLIMNKLKLENLEQSSRKIEANLTQAGWKTETDDFDYRTWLPVKAGD